MERISNLVVISSGFDMELLLPNFQGSRLFVKTSFLPESDVVGFLEKWKSGEGYEQLEFVQILNISSRRSMLLNHARILGQIDIKRFDISKKLPKFSYWKRSLTRNVHWWESDHFSSGFYMIRDTDGVVASVSMTPDVFNFGVWKMTETEILDRMSNGTLEIQSPEKWHTVYKTL